MPLSLADWENQFRRQSIWTRGLRNILYRKINLVTQKNILDLGCGTGIITEEICARTSGIVVGIDKNKDMLSIVKRSSTTAQYVLGDAMHIPFASKSFDVVLCHFFLMWMKNPSNVLDEMNRITKKRGYIVALAEPDYGGRIDYPDMPLANLMAESLIKEGADPYIGRKLRALFVRCHLETEVGVSGSLWDIIQLEHEFDSEWDVIEKTIVTNEQLEQIKKLDRNAIKCKERLLYMPIFWAVGRKI